MKKVILLIVMSMFLTINVACSKQEDDTNNNQIEPISRTELFMGTAIKITLYDSENEEALNKAFDYILEVENLVSANKEGTELDNINKEAGKNKVKVSDTTYNIIKEGLEYSKMSEGDYDISIGPLVKLWSIGLEGAKVPTVEEIDEVLKYIDYNKVEMNDETKEVFLTEEGMSLDLGSIAKGYTADKVVEILKDEGIEKAIIDLGGNIYTLGEKEEGKDWTIGIQNPFDARGNVVGSLKVSDKSVVTTGVYERFIEEDGVKYHHVLNPKTGYPFETNIAGVTIVSDKSIDGDALSTLIFTKGVEEGLDIIEGMDGVEAIFITEDKEVFITTGLSESFEIMNENFVIKE